MLKLTHITKKYDLGDTQVDALRDITVNLRRNEFVAILGPSGCGKTTLLNIIGGLDRYTSGQLEIAGRPTSSFSDRDWDSYRNHSIGFVFQSYNLIPHQTVLANVELALTISGVGKRERRARAVAALERVGLGDQLNKKPMQMSGGQMQRVAIARALVNNPEILLADEPTGALDTATSVQIMEILKEIAADKLVIMVTHNPELADQYANRIISVRDGVVVGDTNPWDGSGETYGDTDTKKTSAEKKKRANKKTSMSLGTALSLSLNNLMTKKARTMLVSFAGSIGIIGIALILALSTGINDYIRRVQEDTLSSYPIQIQSQTVDMTALMTSLSGEASESSTGREDGKVYANNMFGKMMNTFLSQVRANNLEKFKQFLEDKDNGMQNYISSVSYTYDLDMLIFSGNTSSGVVQVNPSPLIAQMMSDMGNSMSSDITTAAASAYRMNVFSEMIDDEDLLRAQYDVVAGRWPSNYDEVVIVIDKRNGISDLALYTIGLKDQAEASEFFQHIMKGETYEVADSEYTYDELLALNFKLLLRPDIYAADADGKYVSTADYAKNDKSAELLAKQIEECGIPLKVVGIIRPSVEAVSTSISGTVAYTSALTREYINRINAHKLVKDQIADPTVDVLTGLPFKTDDITIEIVKAFIAAMPEEERAKIEPFLSMLPEEQIIEMFKSNMPTGDNTYEKNMTAFGSVNLDKPASISIYAKTFADKDEISDAINAYNKRMEAEGHEEDSIKYTDYVKILMSSITTIIEVITGVLIAFVAISLIVSSIMIGVITYISVLERTKEIGILRAIGASKRDVARVFNAETMIIGITSGALGIGVTALLIIPTNIIIHAVSGFDNIGAKLPILGAVLLIVISVTLTLISGLIPSLFAAKKDPVIALRTE